MPRRVLVNETVITVQGRFSAFYPPERATISIAVHHQSELRQEAWENTTVAASAVRTHIEALVVDAPDVGPVT